MSYGHPAEAKQAKPTLAPDEKRLDDVIGFEPFLVVRHVPTSYLHLVVISTSANSSMPLERSAFSDVITVFTFSWISARGVCLFHPGLSVEKRLCVSTFPSDLFLFSWTFGLSLGCFVAEEKTTAEMLQGWKWTCNSARIVFFFIKNIKCLFRRRLKTAEREGRRVPQFLDVIGIYLLVMESSCVLVSDSFVLVLCLYRCVSQSDEASVAL